MEQQNNKEHLHILWTNADVTTAKLMVMMYARNAMKNGWWKEVTVIVWGATVKLLAENEELQEELKRAESFGVKFTGCIACAEELNLVDKMKEIGLDLYKLGPPLTELIKSGAPLLTI